MNPIHVLALLLCCFPLGPEIAETALRAPDCETAPFPARSFEVVWAAEGGGLRNGRRGRLHFDEPFVSFVGEGTEKILWSVPWDRITGLHAAGGLWDVRHPLVLEVRDGSPRYLAQRGSDGPSVSPGSLLKAFERARSAARDPEPGHAAPCDRKEPVS